MIFKIAIIEDESEASDLLLSMIHKYEAENSQNHFEVCQFSSASSFLFDFQPSFDLIFLDIQMPGINGMEAAKLIREKDNKVLIVFVTNMAQYAVEGYSVRAYDFLLKPINYARFSMKFERICHELSHQNNDAYLTITNKRIVQRIRVNDILYIEVSNHDLIVHLSDEKIVYRGTMKEVEQNLEGMGFSRCSNSFLVHLKYVRGLKGDNVVVGEETLRISQTKRSSFLADYALFVGGSR